MHRSRSWLKREARLSAVNALLNIDGKNSSQDLQDDTLVLSRRSGGEGL